MKHPEREDKTSQSSVVTDSLAYVGTAVATMGTMWVTIREALYSNMLKMGLFDKIRDTRNTALQALAARASGKEGTQPIANLDFLKEMKQRNKDYAKGVNNLLREKGLTNSWKKFVHLNFAQQVGVVITGVTLATVAMGAIISIRRQREISGQLRAMKSRDDDTGNDFRSREAERQQQPQGERGIA